MKVCLYSKLSVVGYSVGFEVGLILSKFWFFVGCVFWIGVLVFLSFVFFFVRWDDYNVGFMRLL